MRHLRRGERNGDCALDIAGTNEWFRLVTLLAERNISETENLDFSFLDLYVSCNTGKCGRVFVMIRIIYYYYYYLSPLCRVCTRLYFKQYSVAAIV